MAESGGDSKGGSGVLTKVFATVFGAVVAPLLVALGVKFLGAKIEEKKEPPTPPLAVVPADKDKDEKDKTPAKDKDEKDKTPAKDKDEKDKTPAKDKGASPSAELRQMVEYEFGKWWWVYERVPEKAPDKLPDTPLTKKGLDKLVKEAKKEAADKDKVAVKEAKKEAADKDKVVVKEPAPLYHFARASGKDAPAIFRFQDKGIQSGARPGALVSKITYENYTLTVEYLWQPLPPPNPGEKAKLRRAGFVLHAQEESKVPWMPGVQCLMQPGDAGSLLLRGEAGRVSVSAHVVEKEEKEKKGPKALFSALRRDYKPDAPAKVVSSGTAGWSGVLHRLYSTQPHAEDEDPIAAKGDPEKANDWNTLECTCDADSITVRLNGKEVNVCKSVTPHRGHIVFLSEGTPIAFRRIDLLPLKK